MSKILLEQYQAIELFARVVTKIDGEKEKFRIEKLNEWSFLNKKLSDYSNKEYAKHQSVKIFGEKENSKKEISAKHPQELYEFCKKIRYSEPIVLEEYKLEDLLKFINGNLSENDPAYFKIDSAERNRLRPYDLHHKLERLQLTKWWLYSYDKVSLDGKNDVQLILRSLLTFHPFGKVEINTYDVDGQRREDYLGKYGLLNNDDKILSLELKLKKTKEKNLQIMFSLGRDEQLFFLGMYRNLGHSFYAGTVMMEPVSPNFTLEEGHKWFFSDIDKDELPRHVWLFLSERERNHLRTPTGITLFRTFDKWHKIKNPEKYT